MPQAPEFLKRVPAPLVRAVVVGALVVGTVLLAKRATDQFSLVWPWSERPPVVTHELVVTQVQDVAKLVSTELTLRDVVTFEQSWLGMNRKALYVVTGKVLAGIDLKKGADVRIDAEARRITITLPRAEILAVDVLNTRTYDESTGILYRFTPADRDRMQQQIRTQLMAAGQQSGLLPQADRSARLMLQSLLARDGFTVDVQTRTSLTLPGQ